jgi:hypothetical protein
VVSRAERGDADGVGSMLPYDLIPLIAVVWLTVRHVRSPHASDRSKRLLVLIAVVSVLIPRIILTPLILVVLLQVGICAYIILHHLIVAPDEQQDQR